MYLFLSGVLLLLQLDSTVSCSIFFGNNLLFCWAYISVATSSSIVLSLFFLVPPTPLSLSLSIFSFNFPLVDFTSRQLLFSPPKMTNMWSEIWKIATTSQITVRRCGHFTCTEAKESTFKNENQSPIAVTCTESVLTMQLWFWIAVGATGRNA